MRRVVSLVAAAAILVTACSASSTTTSGPQRSPTTADPPQVTTSQATHTPVWFAVQYRSGPVDVAHPRFAYLDGGSSSIVDAAFYDAVNAYMVISLNGTAYHYCGIPETIWARFTTANSLGGFYNAEVKGHFDCRLGGVPEY